MTEDLAAAPATATIHLKFLEFRLTIETNSLRAAGRLEKYFRPFLAAPGRGRATTLRAVRGTPVYDAAKLSVWTPTGKSSREPKESYYDRGAVRHILKNRTGMFITIGDGGASIVGDIDRHLNQVVNLANTLFGLSLVDKGYAMVHASAVARTESDEVAVFMGNSGSGKSSLALYVIEQGGYDYISNDRVLLKTHRNGVHVVGLPKKPRVNPGTLLASSTLSRLLRRKKRGHYSRMTPEDLWSVEDKHDVDVQRALGAVERLDGQLDACYVLDWRPSDGGRDIQLLDSEAALNALRTVAKDFGPFDVRRGERDADAEYHRLARVMSISRVTGQAAPAVFAREWASHERNGPVTGQLTVR
jgi:HprK-related kinase B